MNAEPIEGRARRGFSDHVYHTQLIRYKRVSRQECREFLGNFDVMLQSREFSLKYSVYNIFQMLYTVVSKNADHRKILRSHVT